MVDPLSFIARLGAHAPSLLYIPEICYLLVRKVGLITAKSSLLIIRTLLSHPSEGTFYAMFGELPIPAF